MTSPLASSRTNLVARRYAPVAIALAVTMLVAAFSPSVGRATKAGQLALAPAYGNTGGTPDDASGDAASGSASTPATDATGQESGGGSPVGTSPGGSAAAGLEATAEGPWPWSHPWMLSGDRSRCGPSGKLQDEIGSVSPPCAPKFTGNNGGATYAGVTADAVTVVLYRYASNAAVDAVLKQQNLGATEAEDRVAFEAYGEYFNKHYEFYGRKINWVFFLGQCDGTDPTCVRNEAHTIVQRFRPFYVINDASVVPELHDELAREGVVNSGGWHFHPSFRIEHRPFTYDLYPDGVTAARHTAAFWCQKMVGKKASFAGDPRLQQQTRKLGIVTQANPVFRSNADELAKMVAACGTTDVPIVTYNYDIARAQEQMTTIIASLKADGVTTVTCLCDPVMPAFLTQAADQQQYIPEWLISGLPAMSHDFLGRLYSQNQWAHAFGPSMRPQEVKMSDSDHERAWRDVGRTGSPAYLTLNRFMWMRLAAIQIQNAGPNLTPLTIERGTLDSPDLGGYTNRAPWPGWVCCRSTIEAWRFGPGDYTAIKDAKNVYWSATAPSPIDGKAGTYICAEADCPRFFSDQWTPGEPKQPNG